MKGVNWLARNPSEILREALRHGKRKIAVTEEEFERILAFKKAYTLTSNDSIDPAAGVITLRNGSRIMRE